MDNILKVAIPSSNYHKNFSSKLIHNFILTSRQLCKSAKIDCFEQDQECFPSLLESKQKPFDVLVSMGFTALTPELADFYKHHDIKVILFQDDIHGKDNQDFNKKKKWIEFADVLLIPYHNNFLSRKEYSKCHNKAINFPWFAPSSCFKYDNGWDNRKNEILISGCMAPVYSLRRNLRNLAQNIKCLHVLDHPGYKPKRRKHQFIGDKYYELLSNYKYAAATSADAPLNYPLSKYFEIPACGCVGLFEEIGILSDFGFESGKHYVPITNSNYEYVIKDISKNIDKFKDMSKFCKEHVKQYHTDIHRARKLINIIKNL